MANYRIKKVESAEGTLYYPQYTKWYWPVWRFWAARGAYPSHLSFTGLHAARVFLAENIQMSAPKKPKEKVSYSDYQ